MKDFIIKTYLKNSFYFKKEVETLRHDVRLCTIWKCSIMIETA